MIINSPIQTAISKGAWWKNSLYSLDNIYPSVAADFSRQRYVLNGAQVPFSSIINLSSTTKWVVNSAGILAQVPVNTPAIDYSTGRARLVLEGASTNLCLYSQQIGNANWVSFNGTSVANSMTAPDNTSTGYQITSAGSGGGWYSTGISVTSGTTYTASAWFKYVSGSTTLRLVCIGQSAFGAAGGDRFIDFNGSTGAFVSK